ETMSEGAAPTAASEKSADSSAITSGSDYSTTNIQVEGVDEADIVKNDGKYIYAVSGNKLKIIDAYPAENMKVLSEMNISGISNIYINNNKLIVFANSYGTYSYGDGIAKESISSVRCLGCGYGESLSLVYIYDISDKENPVLDSNLSVEGNYVDSRMINDFVYVVSTKYVNTENPEPPIYTMNGAESKVSANDIYYWPYQDTSYVFTSIMAVDIENGEFNNKVYLTGSTNTIFVSQDNIYLTYQKTADYKEYAEQIAKEVYYPILSSKYDDKIKEVLDSDKNNWEKLNEMQEIVNDYGNSLENSNEISDFSSDLMKKLEEFNIKIQKETEKTVVHKINVDNDNIEYLGVGEVPGTVLNQFSMDEYNGYFRIATTTGNWRQTSLNHLYVLDENLKIVGSVEDLAKGERIYSVRFLGDRAYMVTFRQVDPLFVIELSNPEKPEVLGYLKITGFSDYLHPYDENHIIGIGKQATEEGRTKGMKIALFDVSDVVNPVEESKIEIGDMGTDSNALYDHRAFLFNKEKKLLVLPISVYESKEMRNEFGRWTGSDIVFNGAYVFNIDDKEISVRGKITHFDSKSKYGPAKDEEIGTERDIYGQIYTKIGENSWEIDNAYYDKYSKTVYTDEYIDQQPGGINYNNLYDYKYQVQRSLYIDNVLYTISNAEIKANDLASVDEINSLDLNYKEDYYPYPLYEGGIAI
ncbi:MAG: beta-propeller domain-containing protein, partial [Nanoarchaeota archaeon]|nr:beta-propeller domain-containing protein [Nanoarchaeota archaeon]